MFYQLSVKPSANVSCQLKFWPFVSRQLTSSRPSKKVSIWADKKKRFSFPASLQIDTDINLIPNMSKQQNKFKAVSYRNYNLGITKQKIRLRTQF